MVAHIFSKVLLVALSTIVSPITMVEGASQVSSSNVCAVSLPQCVSSQARPTNRPRRRSIVKFEPDAIVADACASYSDLDSLNSFLRPYIQAITQKTEFFSYYRLNLFNKQCPFWDDQTSMCGNIACAVNTLDNEEDIPLVWRAAELGKLTALESSRPRRNVQTLEKTSDSAVSIEPDYDFDQMDYCLSEESTPEKSSDYVSLLDNPERFTGYSGVGAQQVWETIYEENCFTRQNGLPHEDDDSSPAHISNALFPVTQYFRRPAPMEEFQSAFQQAIARREPANLIDPLGLEDDCLEKRVFYHVVSGMHASISSHLCWDYLNQLTGKRGPNLECYKQKVYNYPERVSNIYFNYALLLRATAKLQPFMRNIQFRSADPVQDVLAGSSLAYLVGAIENSSKIFDETVMFKSDDAHMLKDDFRNRFRNISRIMDCVGCDKCRLWGKIQTAGYGTALKILFDFDESNALTDSQPMLRRTELVALINTLARVSHSLDVHQQFKAMIESEESVPVAKLPPIIPADQAISKPSSVNQKIPKSASPLKERQAYSKPHHQEEEDEEQTIGSIFWDEIRVVTKMTIFVLKSWWQFPQTVWRILNFEFHRVWHFWLGLEGPTGGWYFRLPDMSDLREL